MCYGIFVVRSQAGEVFDDLRRGLGREGTPELGIPRSTELRAVGRVVNPGGWRGSPLKEISFGAGPLKGNVLILKAGHLRAGRQGVAYLGENGATWSLSKLAGDSETDRVGRTFFSPEIAARDVEQVGGVLSETSDIAGWTIAVYRQAEIGEWPGFEDEEVRTPAEADVETTVSIWHELLMHALPANLGGSHYLHQTGDANRVVPVRMVVPEAREQAIERAIRQNATGGGLSPQRTQRSAKGCGLLARPPQV
ncbi:MAG: hypothetical protein HY673_08860 [Chloroflexi bacterium]|nr:hypothetical protein [Chloroflexota bacterium]